MRRPSATADQPVLFPRPGKALGLILAIALLLRLVLAAQTTVYHADEVWQYLEPAYGLVTGHWVRTWEFHEGIRGWFIPLLLAPSLALGHALSPTTQAHIYLVRAFLGLLSLAVPLACFDLARPISRRHALVAAFVAAIWCEIFYFGIRTSGEGLALTVLFPAMALAQRLRQTPAPRMAVALGVLLAFGIVLRFQYMPAIAVIALWALSGSPRQVVAPLLAGSALGMAIGGAADLVGGQPPLLWIWRSIEINLTQGRSGQFGTAPPWWLVEQMGLTWGWTALAIVPAFVVGARRYPAPVLAAVSIVALHSAIPHKEVRFILLAEAIVIFVAAVGSVDLLNRASRRARLDIKGRTARFTLALLCLVWAAMNAIVGTTLPFAEAWQRGDKLFTTLALAGVQPGICGLATYQGHAHPMLAYSFINRPVQFLLIDGPQAPAIAAANQSHFNVAIAPLLAGRTLPAAYRLVTCYGEGAQPEEERKGCIFVRPGRCTPGAGDFDYNTAMDRRGN